MRITILSTRGSWFDEKFLNFFVTQLKSKGFDDVKCVYSHKNLEKGDVAFFLSYYEVVDKESLKKHKNNLVIHASNLPKGKGWSPMTHLVLKGENNIPLTLIEAEEKLDSGDIYIKGNLKLQGSELIEEIQEKVANNTLDLCLSFLKKYPHILDESYKQIGRESFFKQRSPKDSQLDINKTIVEQFNLLRVCDNEKYPAFFMLNGQKYYLKITKD